MNITELLKKAYNYGEMHQSLLKDKYSLTSFLTEHKEAINYTRCCTQLLCLNTHETWDITEGKVYDKEGENQREYIITDDKGKRAKYFKRHFEEIQN